MFVVQAADTQSPHIPSRILKAHDSEGHEIKSYCFKKKKKVCCTREDM